MQVRFLDHKVNQVLTVLMVRMVLLVQMAMMVLLVQMPYGIILENITEAQFTVLEQLSHTMDNSGTETYTPLLDMFLVLAIPTGTYLQQRVSMEQMVKTVPQVLTEQMEQMVVMVLLVLTAMMVLLVQTVLMEHRDHRVTLVVQDLFI